MATEFILIENNPLTLDSMPKDVHLNEFTCQLGNGFLHAFSCQIKSAEILTTSWQEINSLLATDFITNFESDFNRWNSYLLFICEEEIDDRLRFKIENDKFAMRKIVVDSTDTQLVTDKIAELLDQKILSSKLQVGNSRSDKTKPQNIQLSGLTASLIGTGCHDGNTTQQKEKRKAWLKQQLEVVRKQLLADKIAPLENGAKK